MTARMSCLLPLRRAPAIAALLLSGVGVAGCANMSDGMTAAFADPAKYELYDCKQLEAERKNLANRSAELQGLIAKADTGVAGPVVAELAYRNEYIAVRGQTRLAEEGWRRNKCHDTPIVAGKPVSPVPVENDRSANPRARSSTAVY